MTQASHTASATPSAGAAMLPAIAAIILAVLWGAYTALIIVEIAATPLP
ncbi:MAG: hypothetical protein AB7T59_08940 [Hyphomonadaceae bacterium]